MRGEARLHGLWRIMYSKTISLHFKPRTFARTSQPRRGFHALRKGFSPHFNPPFTRTPQPRRGFHALREGFSPHTYRTSDARPSPAGASTPSERASARPQGLPRPQKGLQPARRGFHALRKGFSPHFISYPSAFSTPPCALNRLTRRRAGAPGCGMTESHRDRYGANCGDAAPGRTMTIRFYVFTLRLNRRLRVPGCRRRWPANR